VWMTWRVGRYTGSELGRFPPSLAASTTVEQTAEHSAVAERVRMEQDMTALTPRVQSDALRLQQVQTQLEKLLCRVHLEDPHGYEPP
jgi:hypothetical protein